MGKGQRGPPRGSVLHCPRVVNAAWSEIQRSAKVGAPGLMNFIIAVANHFCGCPPCLQRSRNLEHRLKPISFKEHHVSS